MGSGEEKEPVFFRDKSNIVCDEIKDLVKDYGLKTFLDGLNRMPQHFLYLVVERIEKRLLGRARYGK